MHATRSHTRKGAHAATFVGRGSQGLGARAPVHRQPPLPAVAGLTSSSSSAHSPNRATDSEPQEGGRPGRGARRGPSLGSELCTCFAVCVPTPRKSSAGQKKVSRPLCPPRGGPGTAPRRPVPGLRERGSVSPSPARWPPRAFPGSELAPTCRGLPTLVTGAEVAHLPSRFCALQGPDVESRGVLGPVYVDTGGRLRGSGESLSCSCPAHLGLPPAPQGRFSTTPRTAPSATGRSVAPTGR